MSARIKRCLDSRIVFGCASSSVLMSAILVNLTIAPRCGATERYFHDLRVESSNHRYVIEVTSPDNAEGAWRRAFQSRFVYRLTDQSEGRQIWSREQPMRDDGNGRRRALEGPPAAVYVSNEGWVVIRTADHGHPMELLTVSRAGKVTGRLQLFDMLLKSGKSIWAISTAGIHWGTRYCYFYFDHSAVLRASALAVGGAIDWSSTSDRPANRTRLRRRAGAAVC